MKTFRKLETNLHVVPDNLESCRVHINLLPVAVYQEVVRLFWSLPNLEKIDIADALKLNPSLYLKLSVVHYKLVTVVVVVFSPKKFFSSV